MCDRRVIERVRQGMLTRRDLFRTGVAAAAAGAGAAVPVRAEGLGELCDLTHEFHEDFPTISGVPGITTIAAYSLARDGFSIRKVVVNEHAGTHIDAPLHFSADGRSVAEIPLEDLTTPLAIIDIRARAANDPDTVLTPDDIRAWIRANGPLPHRGCVAMLSGWEAHLGTPVYRNADEEGRLHFPGVHAETAMMLRDETAIIGIAVDTLSLDRGVSDGYEAHHAWLPYDRWALENVASLDRLPASGAVMIVGAPKWRGGTGGPTRVFAVI